jgi:hypothetical protein
MRYLRRGCTARDRQRVQGVGTVLRVALALAIVVSAFSFLPTNPPRAALAAATVCADAVEHYAPAPRTRHVLPISILRIDTNGGRVERPEGLLARGGDTTLVERTPGGDPAIVLDFGNNVSGHLHVTTTASSSPLLHLAVSESLTFLGRGSDVTWGEHGTQMWRPPQGAGHFESVQLTFRYVMLFLSETGSVEIDEISLYFTPFLGTPDRYAGCFESSDDELNRIWYAGAYTLELNTVALPDGREMIFDGAKRDRAVWIGDLAVQARIEHVTHYRPNAIRDSLADMAVRQRHDGSIPPASFMEYGLILYDYYAWWVVTFAEYAHYTGDLSFAERYYPHMWRQLDWFTSRTGPNGLVVKDAGVEWALSLGRNGEITYLNAVYYKALIEGARLADSLGRTQDAAIWRQRAALLREAMNSRLFDHARGVYVTSDLDRDHIPQDGNALAVLFEIAQPEWRAGILTYLRDNMWTPFGSTTVDPAYGYNLMHDKRIWPFAGYFELEARFATGDDAGAHDLLRRQWGHMLRQGPGTMWEWMRADGTLESGFASLAHGWSAGPTASLTERVLGVRLVDPGYTRFDVVPHPGDLNWARGSVPTPHGTIDAEWHRWDGLFQQRVTVPSGTSARVGVPVTEAGAVVLVNGHLAWDGARSRAFGAWSDGRYVYVSVPAGQHSVNAWSDWAFHPETGNLLYGTFKGFWARSGGLPVFGHPMTAMLAEDGRPVQYFERQRFEYHDEHRGTPYEVLLGLLGIAEARDRGLLDHPAFQAVSPDAAEAECEFVAETGHTLCGRFLEYWTRHGLEFGDPGVSYRESLALFGYPISEPFIDPDTGLLTQYFERARFEYHANNADPWRVLLGRVGATLLDRMAEQSKAPIAVTP